MKYRKAKKSDIDALLSLERGSFDSDKLERRNFAYFLSLGHSSLIVQVLDNEIVGYGLLLFHRGTALARLYSIAISQKHQGQGLGKKLLMKLEEDALENECSYLRLEVSIENKSAIKLYEKSGYRKFALKKDYYENHSDALCYEKKIKKFKSSKLKVKVPYYRQTTDFTCGPSSLMMAMSALSKKIKPTRALEIQLWREATTIFMTSGHGGCGPHGLALSAHKRGFEVELYINTSSSLFVEGVRSKHKKEIIKLVQKSFEDEIKKEKIACYYDEYSWETIEEIFKSGGIPIMLISAYRLTESKAPHWIVLTGIEGDFIFFHDPEVSKDQSAIDNMHVPIRKDEFNLMAKFGSKQLKSIIALY